MPELTDTEKKLAVLVIREMDKNRRSIMDLERGADAVLQVFRKVTHCRQALEVHTISTQRALTFG